MEITLIANAITYTLIVAVSVSVTAYAVIATIKDARR